MSTPILHVKNRPTGPTQKREDELWELCYIVNSICLLLYREQYNCFCIGYII
jgi:hypothetical protein